jgi:hypothetical protein
MRSGRAGLLSPTEPVFTLRSRAGEPIISRLEHTAGDNRPDKSVNALDRECPLHGAYLTEIAYLAPFSDKRKRAAAASFCCWFCLDLLVTNSIGEIGALKVRAPCRRSREIH